MTFPCYNCEYENSEGAESCRRCGKKLQSPSKSAQTYMKPEMVLITGGKFRRKFTETKTVKNKGFFNWLRGNTTKEIKIESSVEISVNSFYIGKYPVTNKEYKFYKQNRHGKWFHDSYPVETVSFYDAIEYCNWLSEKEGLSLCYSGNGDNIVLNMTEKGYRLPTEAESEYACRGGTTTEYYWGDEMDEDYCWYCDNSGSVLHSAGLKKPNKFGLYDMSGNIWEWCWNWHDKKYYPGGSVDNPTGPSAGKYRSLRGGSWCGNAESCQSGDNDCNTSPEDRCPYIGFRLARSGP